jgi:hypothetical protein
MYSSVTHTAVLLSLLTDINVWEKYVSPDMPFREYLEFLNTEVIMYRELTLQTHCEPMLGLKL